MSSGGCEKTSDEIFNFECTPCSKINKKRKAVKYCVQCQGYCCQSCVDMHKGFPPLEGHKLLDESNFNTATFKQSLPSVPTEICIKHRIKIVDMYCGNHDFVGCTSCITLNHRNCTDVHLISEVADHILQKTNAKVTFVKLQEKKATLGKIKTSREVLLEELNKSRADAVNGIKDFRMKMGRLLDNIEKESIKEVDKEFQAMKSRLLEEIKKSVTQTKTIQQALDSMKQGDGNIAQQFVSIKIAEKIIAQTEDVLNSVEEEVDVKISFTADKDILKFLAHLDTFGSVAASTYRNTVYSIKETKEINIKIPNDYATCTVYGSCLTPDGKLLLTDCNNRKLKRFDIVTLTVVDYRDLPGFPSGVCCIDDLEAAVTLNNNTIQFISLDNQMKLTRSIKLGHSCWGIAYQNKKLFITDNSRSVFIHDMTGTLLQTISTDSSGNKMFLRCRHIAFSDVANKMYVADIDNKIVTLDWNGKHISNFIDLDLINGIGVCSDRRGNIFACGYKSQNVVQVRQDGQKIGTVVKSSDGLVAPTSLAFSLKLCTLIVTDESSEKIKLFKLK